ncbi:MAG: hypothetical protein Q8J64_00420 [Thermodesulfovibrionales bacterium]|nr:hypothetical protein [Thermodesulfovibrionales bacterium]
MPGNIRLLVGGVKIEDFISYQVASDLFQAADAFSFELSMPLHRNVSGLKCELYVNDILELTGIIDRENHKYDKGKNSYSIEGRDLMGLLVDSYCEEFPTLEGIELKALAERLLKPFMSEIKKIEYGKGNKDRAVPLKNKKEEFESIKIQQGQTVFEVLRDYALSRGLLFFSLPDGTLVFGEPATSGEAAFKLVCRKDGQGNNVIEGERVLDYSKRYSKVTVSGQTQDGKPVKDFVLDTDVKRHKPFIGQIEFDGQSPKKYANILLNKQRFEGFQLRYKTDGHGQGSRNFQVNSICHVKDEVFGLDENMLIYGRTFEMSKAGVFTTLKLSKLGVLPA